MNQSMIAPSNPGPPGGGSLGPNPDGQRRSSRRSAPPSGPAGVVRGAGRGRRLPWVALGVLLTAGAVLAFALFTISQSSRTLVWVAGADIPPGATIERSQLTLVAVGADPGVKLLGRGQESVVLGAVARGAIPAGTPLSVGLVVKSEDSVPPGSAVVGALLQPGQYPSSRIAAGDRVELMVTVPTGGTESQLAPASSLGPATVWQVDAKPPGSSGKLFISMLVPVDRAIAASNAAASDRLRLVLVNASSPDAGTTAPGSGSGAGLSSGSGPASSSAVPAAGPPAEGTGPASTGAGARGTGVGAGTGAASTSGPGTSLGTSTTVNRSSGTGTATTSPSASGGNG